MKDYRTREEKNPLPALCVFSWPLSKFAGGFNISFTNYYFFLDSLRNNTFISWFFDETRIFFPRIFRNFSFLSQIIDEIRNFSANDWRKCFFFWANICDICYVRNFGLMTDFFLIFITECLKYSKNLDQDYPECILSFTYMQMFW